MTDQTINPFFEEWDTPFGMPPFDRIKPEHFMPAFEEGMRKQLENIERITSNPEAPTFENTIEMFERSDQNLERVVAVFFNLTSSHTNDEIQKIQREIVPRLTVHETSILMDEGLFKRVNAVYDSKEGLDLTLEEDRLLEEIHNKFIRTGAALDQNARNEVKALDEKISRLTTSFGQNVLKDTNAFELVLETEEELEGLPESVRSAAAEEAIELGHPGKYAFTISRSSFTPFMKFSANRDLRERLYTAYIKCGNNGTENDNKETVSKIASLRARRARLLGFETHAQYMLDDRMAKSPEAAKVLLNKVWHPAQKMAKQEADGIQEKIQKEGANFKLAPWDWWYYAEKVRTEKYDLNEEDVKPYFVLDKVRDGAFTVATRLFGLTFERRYDIPTYHSEVQSFEVKDKDGNHVGLFLADYHMRTSKRGGAWMNSVREQSKLDGKVRPIVFNTCNFPKGIEGEPTLLGFEEVKTLFHEFGHALHGLMSQVTYESLSGTSVKRDFVELPSQIYEHWGFEKEVLKSYATHKDTGESIPDALIEKILKARKFNQGFQTTEYLAACFLDLAWHNLKDGEIKSVQEFEEQTMEDIGLIPEIALRYRSTYFQHIFSGGYSAGYYSYIWAEVLDADGYDLFKQNGIFDQATAQSFRENILERGGTDDPMELYKKFRGREPSVEPLLAKRGLE